MKLKRDRADLADALPRLMQRPGIPSASWALVSGGKIADYGATGRASANSNATATPYTVYEAASITKPVFAYLVNKLALQGMIELDRPISDLLDHELFTHDPRSLRITSRHVLTHTTGLPNWRRHTGELRTYFEPGSRFSYSGEAFILLQRLVEHLLNTDLNTAVREYIFKPLGMTHSSFIWPCNPLLEACVGHSSSGEPVEKTRLMEPDAAGALHTTAIDLARFMCGLIRDEEARSHMLQPGLHVSDSMSHHRDWPDLSAPLDDRVSWAQGIGLEESSEGVNFWQWGDNEGWKALLVGCAEHSDGVVILTNSQAGQQLFAPFLAAVSDSTHPGLEWLERMSLKVRVSPHRQ